MNIIQKIKDYRLANAEAYDKEKVFSGTDNELIARLQGNVEACDWLLSQCKETSPIIAGLIDTLNIGEISVLRDMMLTRQCQLERALREQLKNPTT